MFSLVKVDATSHIDCFSITIPNFRKCLSIDMRNFQENAIPQRERRRKEIIAVLHSAVQRLVLYGLLPLAINYQLKIISGSGYSTPANPR